MKFFLMRILIFFVIFAIGSLILDIFPLKEMVYYFVKKVNKKEVAIDIGIGQIIELKKTKVKVIYNINLIIGIIQIVGSIFTFALISLLLTGSISIESLLIGGQIISETTAEYITISVFSIFSVILLLSGALLIYYNQELKKMGV